MVSRSAIADTSCRTENRLFRRFFTWHAYATF